MKVLRVGKVSLLIEICESAGIIFVYTLREACYVFRVALELFVVLLYIM